ncbi:hypothetical protein [Halosolutus gelatinilyticus]|uniref:hypothetical protein n=1 Tax=Halosolutus gelatinilyticus TaxID=2931975 RepID=UPI001FF3D8B8|nr:hypothetical protein [Halosolutus gelatinilyticus]
MTRQSVRTASRSRSSALSATDAAASAGAGILAAAVGYLVTYALVASDVRAEFGGNVAEWKGVAWYSYSAHLVDVEVSGVLGGTESVNFIAQYGSSSATALYVVPPLVLAIAGAALAYRWDVRTIGEAVLTGAPVTIGYGLVAGLGAVVAETSASWTIFGIEARGSIAPELLPAIVLAGVLYPLVFATAGAIVVAVVGLR